MLGDDLIMKHLNGALTSSKPGDTLHHLYVFRVAADAIGPLDTISDDNADLHIYAIDADSKETATAMPITVLIYAAAEARRMNDVIVFISYTQEAFIVDTFDLDGRARKLHAEDRLYEHRDAVEVTMLYAACRDGRRWRGMHYLTGPHAGTTTDVDLLVGRPQAGESCGVPLETALRRAVGITT